MSGSMIDYIKEYGDFEFAKRPFCDADSVVLAQLCYFKFDGLLHDADAFMRDLADDKSRDAMFEDPKYARQNSELFDCVITSARFRDLKISHYVSITDSKLQTQFSAVTFVLPGEFAYVAYRGTDETMVGWKEDFNLTYMNEVPAQTLAVSYLRDAADRIDGRFYVGGHSKGGHLSIYASMHADQTIQDRLILIYCMDGPGFMKSMLVKDGYERIRDRIVKLLPQSGLIGMLQERDDNYTVIKSTGVDLMQHNLYTWRIEKGELVPEGELKDSAKVRNEAINDWIESLTPESRQKFIDALYEIILSCGAESRVDYMANFVKNTSRVIGTIRDMDNETLNMLKEITGRLFESAAIHFKAELESNDPRQTGAPLKKNRSNSKNKRKA